MTSTTTAPLDIQALRGRIHGTVLEPGDDGYDEARVVAAGGIDRRPAVIVKVADTDDVREVIATARATGRELAVRAGGHSGAAHSVVDDGIVLDVRGLDALEIDVAGRTAWAGAGLTAIAYTRAADAHDLATGFGDTGSVGIAGLTLGGGIGYLVRRDGLTIDNLLAVELVTADGRVHVVDADHEPDLFWAVRGGGGNVGVATKFHYRLHPVAQVTGGMLLLPATASVLAETMRILTEAPEWFSAIVNVMPCPPMPFVPESEHGKVVAMVMACAVGAPDEAAAAIAPIRALATPIADLVGPIRYPEMYPPDDADYHPLAVATTIFLDTFGEAEAATALAALESSDAPMRVVQLRALGGAAARVPNEATAFGHRDRRFMAAVAAFHLGPDDQPAKQAWVDGLAAALHPAPGAYVNFLADEGPERVHDAYPAGTWERLARIKREVDPENLFRRNQNVPPAEG